MKKRICIVKYSFTEMGGAENVAVNLFKNFSNEFDVYLVSITSSKDTDLWGIKNSNYYSNFFYGKFQIKDVLFKGIFKLRKFLKEKHIDSVLSIGLPTNIFVAGATLGLGIETFFCEHGNAKQNPTRLSFLHRYIAVRLFTKIVTLTEEDKLNYLSMYSNLSEVDVVVIPNWIDLADYENVKYNSNSKKILTVGRFCKEKGYDLLGLVAMNVLKKCPTWTWDIYGQEDGVYSAELKDILSKNGLSDRVIFKGLILDKKLIYPEHSIYVMTSYFEGFPLVLLEAQASLLPIVAFRCPTGPGDIVVDNKTGYLIDAYDTDDMSDKLLKLIDAVETREIFSQNISQSLTRFSKDHVMNLWINLLNNK